MVLSENIVQARLPLPYKHIDIPEWFNENEERRGYWEKNMKVLFFNPTEVYNRLKGEINPYERIQSIRGTISIFPKTNDGLCRCGCGKEAKRQWATQNCANFAYQVSMIIIYGTSQIGHLLEYYYGKGCVVCNNTNDIEIDHIIPVKHGGGGCWLSNFHPLCHKCHLDKTHKDFNWGKYRLPSRPLITNQTQLF